MPTQGRSGFGALLRVGDGATPTEVFTALLEVTSLENSGENRETVDITHHASPGGFREVAAGLGDGGEVSGEGNIVLDATQKGLRTDLLNETLRNFQLMIPVATAERLSFAGIVTSFTKTLPLDDVMRYAFTIKVSGLPVLELDT